MTAIWKIAIATVVFAAFCFVYNSMAGGGHASVWALAGAVYGAVCYPWFKSMRG